MHLTPPPSTLSEGLIDRRGPGSGSGPAIVRTDALLRIGAPPDEALRLLVQRHNLRDTCLVSDPDATGSLAPGEVRLRIDEFALTSSNLVYAALADAFQYWSLFPTGHSRFGCVPVWGFATVIESCAEGVRAGARCFGCWPMGSHHIARPRQVSTAGFIEGAPHRQQLPVAFNRVSFCADRGGADEVALSRRAYQALLGPQFISAFTIHDILDEGDCFGARQMLLSSAASKTACSIALCLLHCMDRSSSRARLTGLTAAAHLAFTQASGCYDQVLSYDDLHALDPTVQTIYIDLSGSTVQRNAVQRHFRGALTYSCEIGTPQSEAHGASLWGPRPTLFATSPIPPRRRSHSDSAAWHAAGFEHRLEAAWQEVLAVLTARRPAWLQAQRDGGAAAVRSAWTALVEGRAGAYPAHMLSFTQGAPHAAPQDTQGLLETAETVDTSSRTLAGGRACHMPSKHHFSPIRQRM